MVRARSRPTCGSGERLRIDQVVNGVLRVDIAAHDVVGELLVGAGDDVEAAPAQAVGW